MRRRIGQELPRGSTELRGHLLDDRPLLVPLLEQVGAGTVASAFDLRGGPGIGPDAVEVARHDVGGHPDEVREQIVDRPLGGCRYASPTSSTGRGYRPVVAVAWAAQPDEHGMTQEAAMEMRRVGSLEVSVAGLGCNNFGMRIDEDASKVVTHAALDAGVNHFDTADIYGKGRSEEFLGRALGSHRDEAVITTKVGMQVPEGEHGGSEPYVTRHCDESLTRLGTDRIDLYLLHQPDPETPIGETLSVFAKLIAAGKVLEIGCSNFSGAQLEEAEQAASELGVPRFVNAQNDFSLLNRSVEDDVLPVCERLDVLLMPYFPLASGMLTGKYRRGEEHPEGSRLAAWGSMAGQFASEEKFDVVERLADYAVAHDHTLAELALSWLAGTPAVGSVIAGATTPEQVRANAAATTAWMLSDVERAEVDALARVGA